MLLQGKNKVPHYFVGFAQEQSTLLMVDNVKAAMENNRQEVSSIVYEAAYELSLLPLLRGCDFCCCGWEQG